MWAPYWLWGNSQEYSQPASGHTPKETDTPYPSNHKLSKGSKLVVGARGSSPPCWNVDWLDLLQAARAAVMSGMHWSCHGKKDMVLL